MATCPRSVILPIGRCPWQAVPPQGRALWAHAGTKLWSVQRAHPFGAATLADDDLTVDFAALTTPNDRVAVVATEPLTADEAWLPFAPGEQRVFEHGLLVPQR